MACRLEEVAKCLSARAKRRSLTQCIVMGLLGRPRARRAGRRLLKQQHRVIRGLPSKRARKRRKKEEEVASHTPLYTAWRRVALFPRHCDWLQSRVKCVLPSHGESCRRRLELDARDRRVRGEAAMAPLPQHSASLTIRNPHSRGSVPAQRDTINAKYFTHFFPCSLLHSPLLFT